MTSSIVNSAADITPPMVGLGDAAAKRFPVGAGLVVQIPRTVQGLFVELRAEGNVEYGFAIVQGASAPAALNQGVSTFDAPARIGAPLLDGEARQFKLPRAADELQTIWLLARSDDSAAAVCVAVVEGGCAF